MSVRYIRTQLGHAIGAIAMRILGPDEEARATAVVDALVARAKRAELELAARTADLETARMTAAALEACVAELRGRLEADREIGIDALLKLARAEGRIPIFDSDPRRVDRFRQIARDGLAELAAELAAPPQTRGPHEYAR